MRDCKVSTLKISLFLVSTFLLSGCGAMDYDTLTGKVLQQTIYTSSSSTAITADLRAEFTDMTPAVLEDLGNVKDNYGLDLTGEVTGQLGFSIISSEIGDGNSSYYNNFGTRNFTCSQKNLEEIVLNKLGGNTTSSEAYVDQTTGYVWAKVDDGEWTDVGNQTGFDNTPLTTAELLPMMDLIAETAGKDQAEIVKLEDGGYVLTYHLQINSELLLQIPETYRQMFAQDGISYEKLIQGVYFLENNPEYNFPMTLTATFVPEGKGFLISSIAVNGSLSITILKNFEELKALGFGGNAQIPDDYSFGIKGSVVLTLDYRNDFGYQPTYITGLDFLNQNGSQTITTP